jgi:hypothetical protein
MTNQAVHPVTMEYAGIQFQAYLLPLSLSAGILPRLSTSAEASREGRQGVIPWVLDDLSAGFLPTSAYGSWARDKARTYRNEGIIVHVPGITCKGYALTTQTNIGALDVSGYRAGNRRVHAAMFDRRFYAGTGPRIIKDTSTSNPALTVPSTNDNVSDDVLCMFIGVFDNTRYLVICTDGQSDDVKGTTAPEDNSISWTSLVTHGDSSDAIWAADHFPDLNGGWNVLIGQLNGTNGIWAVKQSASVPVTSPIPVVDFATREIANASNPTETLVGDAITAAMLFVNSSPGDTEPWASVASAIGSDDSDASNPFADNNETDFLGISLAALDWTDADLPDGVELTDLTITVEAAANNANNNIYFWQLALWANALSAPGATAPDVSTFQGVATKVNGGEGAYGTTPGEIAATDTTYVVSIQPTAVKQLTPAMIRSGALGFSFAAQAGTSPIVNIDDIAAVTVTFRRPGVQLAFNQGGFTCGKLISNPTRLPYVEPEADDVAGITQRRSLRFLDLQYDSAFDRIAASTSTPATGLPYVGVICEFLGGVAVAGGRDSSVWNQVKIVDSSGQTRDLGFPGIHGTEPQTIVKMTAQGSALLVTVADTDGGDSQLWIYFDGAWNALGVLQSKSSAITREPLLWAETTLGDQNGFDYNFLSLSTNIGASRQFVPPDLFADPHLVNTTQVKHTGALYVQTIELDIGGAVEAQKALMSVIAGSRRLDDDTTYGDITLALNTQGDHAFGATQYSNVFQTPFEEDDLVTNNDPGIALRTGIVRLTHGNEDGTAKSPQALPFIFNLVGGFEYQERIRCYLARNAQSVLYIQQQFMAALATKRANRLLGGGWDAPFLLENFVIEYKPDTGTRQPTENDIKQAYIDFLRSPGSTS